MTCGKHLEGFGKEGRIYSPLQFSSPDHVEGGIANLQVLHQHVLRQPAQRIELFNISAGQIAVNHGLVKADGSNIRDLQFRRQTGRGNQFWILKLWAVFDHLGQLGDGLILEHFLHRCLVTGLLYGSHYADALNGIPT